jgi:N-acetylmuramoyl-L-alanine amidase
MKVSEIEAATPTFRIITATLLPTSTRSAARSETPFPPPPLPALTPVEGITSTQLNVRAEPSTASEVLGIIAANSKIQIVGKDPGENWWQILYPEAGQGKGWVTAQYVSTAVKPEVPVIGGGGTNPENSNVAVIQQQLNVRSGPGTSFNSLGTLNPQDVVALTGKDSNGTWLQIEFSAGPEGKGWINAAFARAQGVDNLPVVSDAGTVIGTVTPENTSLPPTPTIVPAPIDNDSAQAPAVEVTFTATGTRSFQFSSDVSSPTGDTDDWVQFTPFSSRVILELTCTGNGSMVIELLKDHQLVQNWGTLTCGKSTAIVTQVATAYVLHFQAAATTELSSVRFTVKVTSPP